MEIIIPNGYMVLDNKLAFKWEKKGSNLSPYCKN